MRYINWVNLIITVLGSVMIANLLGTSGLNIGRHLQPAVQAALPIIILLILVVLFLYFYMFKVRRDKVRTKVDEMVRAITDKSGRNGLVASYVTLFAVLLYTDASDMEFTLDMTLLVTVIAVSFCVYLASFVYYYYRGVYN